MGFTDLVTFDAINDVSFSTAIQIDNDNNLIVYKNNTSNDLETRVINISGASAGIADTLTPSIEVGNFINICQLTASLYVAIWIEGQTELYTAPISVSGTVATFGAASLIESALLTGTIYYPSICKLSDTKALASYSISTIGNYQIKIVTLSGITGAGLTINSLVIAHTLASDNNPFWEQTSLTQSDTNKAYMLWGDENKALKVDLISSVGIVPSVLDTAQFPDIGTDYLPSQSSKALNQLDTQKIIACYLEWNETTYIQSFYAAIITDNGTSITINTPVEYDTFFINSLIPQQYSVKLLDNDIAVWHSDEFGKMLGYILTIDDLDISVKFNINPTLTGVYSENNMYSITGVNTSGIGGIRTGSGIFFTHINQLRYLDMAFDTEKVYITSNDGGTLKVSSIDNNLTLSELNTFGSATYAEIDALTRGLFVRCFPNFLTDRLWLYGRDGNGIQFQFSQDNAASFTDLSGAWGTELAIGCHLYTFNRNDILIILENDDIYHTTDGGDTWIKIGDAPGADVATSERHPIFEQAIIVASSTNGDLDLSVNLGVSFDDISISGGNKINAIKKAF